MLKSKTSIPNSLQGKVILTAICSSDPTRNRVVVVDDDSETELFLERLEEFAAGLAAGRCKRVIVYNVNDVEHRRFLKPGMAPIKRGEIFPNGLALSKALGKLSNGVQTAISKAKVANPEAYSGKFAGLEVAYTEDIDKEFGVGASERISLAMEQRRISDGQG